MQAGRRQERRGSGISNWENMQAFGMYRNTARIYLPDNSLERATAASTAAINRPLNPPVSKTCMP